VINEPSVRSDQQLEHDPRANAFRVCREGRLLRTFPDRAGEGMRELALWFAHDGHAFMRRTRSSGRAVSRPPCSNSRKQSWHHYMLLATLPGDRAFPAARDSGCPLTKQVRQRDGSPSKCRPAFSFWLSTIFPENRFALVRIMLERAD